MGRTIRTFRDAVDSEEGRWKDFRRTLRRGQREYLDRVFDCARRRADAGTMIATPRISDVVFLSAMMELLEENDRLNGRIAELEQRVEGTAP